MPVLTLWRKLLYRELKKLELNGDVIDLGGSPDSDYHRLIAGDHRIVAVNIDEKYHPDLKFNLEQKFPLTDQSYDAVLCFNVLEHIFNHQNVLTESLRILKTNGRIIIATPFIFQIHSSPHDYWRYSGECLKRLMEQAGFQEITIKEIGHGICSAACQLKFNLYKFNIIRRLSAMLNVMVDKLLKVIKKNSLLTAKNYPLGYLVTAKK